MVRGTSLSRRITLKMSNDKIIGHLTVSLKWNDEKMNEIVDRITSHVYNTWSDYSCDYNTKEDYLLDLLSDVEGCVEVISEF